jgi:ribose transport system ATP-binding protein
VSDRSPILRMEGICKRFPGVQALERARLEAHAGEVHVLLGENGAGKSTLVKVLCGQVAADAGTIRFDGKEVRPATPLEAERLGFVMIHQEFNLIPGLSVAENVFLGHEPVRAGLIRGEAIRRGARDLLAKLGCTVDPDARMADLSVATQQLVEIARALRRRARVLVMDEPTAALSGAETEALFGVVRSLCAEGVAVIYISHRMRDIFAIGERVTVMRDGRTVAARPVRGSEVGELVRLMVGRPIAEQIPKRSVPIGEVLLAVDGLVLGGGRAPISLAVRSGEILGIAGLMGSGRTELARAIFGADADAAGEIRVAGRAPARRDPPASIRAGVGFITEDRKGQGLVPHRSVLENITLTSLDEDSRLGVLDLRRERARAGEIAARLRIRAASLDQETAGLSGGNQQKVVLARALAAKCRVLILDEPTRGIDVAAKAEIYELIGELVGGGAAIILITSELPELVGLADRVAVLHDGVLQGVLEREHVTQERIMRLALGERTAG